MEYRRSRLSKFAKENPVSGEVKPFTPAGLRLPEDVATNKPVAWCPVELRLVPES